MMKNCCAALAVVTLMCSPAAAQDAQAVIANASKAMGEDALKTVEYSATGFDFALGQNYNSTAPWPKFINKSYTRAIDFQIPASRVARIRTQGEFPQRGGGAQPLRGEQPQNQTIIVDAGTPWVQQLEIWMMPHGFLKAARTNNATAKSQTTGGRTRHVVTFMGKGGTPVVGYINDQNLVERVETRIDNAVLGDMLFEAIYSDYRDFSGVKFPMKIVQKQGGHPIFDLTVGDVKVNMPVTIAAPPPRGGGPAGGVAAAAEGTPSEKLADGVFLILGGYASVAVDFKDYIVLIEAPQSEERAMAIITEAKRLIPNKPIRYVVNTHQHFDHSGGLRPLVAEGATIITHEVHKPFYERTFSAPHSLSPDRLAKAKRAPSIETMTAKKVLTDGNHVIELHHLKGNWHNEGLIFAYLPKERILIEADAYNAGLANAPTPDPISQYNVNLIETVDRLGLAVDRVIPIHYPADRRVVTKAEVLRSIGR